MRIFIISILAIFYSVSTSASEPIAELKLLAPFTGVWKEVQAQNAKGNPDVQRWEWAFKSQVLRIIHGSGSYGGESLIHWDAVREKIIYRYVTNGGFYTDGVITPAEGGFNSLEKIGGTKSGPSDVKSLYQITENGNMQITITFKMNGEWANSFTSTYMPAPDAKIIYEN